MKEIIFKCLVVEEVGEKVFETKVKVKKTSELPEGDVLIKVHYSSLNYKDALSASGNKGVTRQFPHTPGIDAAGIIVESSNPELVVGDEVIVTGYDLGMNTSGGFAEYIRVPGHWPLKLPKNLSLKESMIYGTAGFTAALSVERLVNHGVRVEDGPILVTGATGAVGTIATRLLHKLGYKVLALTGKESAKDSLLDNGASDIILRKDFLELPDKALLKPEYAGVIDTVGGEILSKAIKMTQYSGCVTCCGNVSAHDLNTSIYPFILRGVSLYGIDSVECSKDKRESVWNFMANDWKPSNLCASVTEINLEEVDGYLKKILAGEAKGKKVVVVK